MNSPFVSLVIPAYNEGKRIKKGLITVKEYRNLLGKGFTWLTNVLLVKNISDITCGFKGFKKDVGLNLFQRQLIYNWSFDAEILFLGQKLGYRIKEVPVTWIDSEGTKVDLKRDIIGSLKGILRIQINYMLKRYKL